MTQRRRYDVEEAYMQAYPWRWLLRRALPEVLHVAAAFGLAWALLGGLYWLAP